MRNQSIGRSASSAPAGRFARPGAAVQPVPVPVGRLEEPANQLESLLNGLSELNARLNLLADRLVGPAAVEAATDADPPRTPAGSLVGRFNVIADDYAYHVRRLGNVLDRLETL